MTTPSSHAVFKSNDNVPQMALEYTKTSEANDYVTGNAANRIFLETGAKQVIVDNGDEFGFDDL